MSLLKKMIANRYGTVVTVGIVVVLFESFGIVSIIVVGAIVVGAIVGVFHAAAVVVVVGHRNVIVVGAINVVEVASWTAVEE